MATAKTYTAKELGLKKQALPHSIVEVVGTLQRAGFDAYIVGGGVRDSLLGLAPKDFDAVTNARPQDIKNLFGSRSRIIGKRFQICHVYSGKEMIEVSTFRAPPKDDNTNDDGMIVRDNVWGTIEQDFERRDFSINALYYDPIGGVVLDFCGALDDIQNKCLRLLGKANKRIEEDPVRLLRALRFMAKLGFSPDKALARQFHGDNWALLEQVSTHRLYDETTKMFTGGYLSALLPLLYQYGASNSLFDYASDTPTPLALQVAKTTDERINKGFGANPAYFYATVLWGNYLYNLAKFKKKLSFYDAQIKSAKRTLERQRLKTAIPNFAEEFITPIWLLQPALTTPKPKDVPTLTKHPRFRAGYDFLVAREMADDHPLAEPTNSMAVWWTNFQLADERGQQSLIDELGGSTRRRRKKPSSQSAAELEQILQLSLAKGKPSDTTERKPLFEFHKAPPKRLRDVPMPTFGQVAYSDDDFARLLADDVKVPAFRKHKKFKVAELK